MHTAFPNSCRHILHLGLGATVTYGAVKAFCHFFALFILTLKPMSCGDIGEKKQRGSPVCGMLLDDVNQTRRHGYARAGHESVQDEDSRLYERPKPSIRHEYTNVSTPAYVLVGYGDQVAASLVG